MASNVGVNVGGPGGSTTPKYQLIRPTTTNSMGTLATRSRPPWPKRTAYRNSTTSRRVSKLVPPSVGVSCVLATPHERFVVGVVFLLPAKRSVSPSTKLVRSPDAEVVP